MRAATPERAALRRSGGAGAGWLFLAALVGALLTVVSPYAEARAKEREIVQGDDPAVSPDGKTLAFRRWVDGNSEIFLAPLDGSAPPRRLTDNPAVDRFPAWSPDGKKICFVSTRSGNKDLWLVDLEHPDEPKRLTINPGPDDEPTWSPDGGFIAYAGTVNGAMELFVISSLGSDPMRLTRDSYDDMHPAWSPDGKRLAFVSNRGDGDNIWMLDLAPISEAGRLTIDASASGVTFHIYQLTIGEYDDRDPAWRPKGDVIAFSSNRGDSVQDRGGSTDPRPGARSIFTISSGPRPILSGVVIHAGTLEEPAWTPDGKNLLYVASPLPGSGATRDEARPVIRLIAR
jgi:Tol biopolymer transport system component